MNPSPITKCTTTANCALAITESFRLWDRFIMPWWVLLRPCARQHDYARETRRANHGVSRSPLATGVIGVVWRADGMRVTARQAQARVALM